MNADVSVSRALSDQVVSDCQAHRRSHHTLALHFAELVDGGHLSALGYATATEYASTVLGMDARPAHELLRIGRRLPDLPTLSAALSAGELEWTKAREILRVVNAENEAAWVAHARAHTSREVERDVTLTAFGGMPPEGDPPAGPARRRVVFVMESSDEEVLRRCLALLRAKTDLRPGEIEDGALLAGMATRLMRVIEEETAPAEDTHVGVAEEPAPLPTPPTGERYRVVIHHCASCATTHVGGCEVSESVVEEANCDADRVEMRPGPKQGHLTRAIPPATRRIVLHRAGWKCEVPGCKCALWLDIHHFREWARGGGHELGNLGVLCYAHHRAVHEGTIAVERLVSGAVRVTHADGRTRTGEVPSVVGGARAGGGEKAA